MSSAMDQGMLSDLPPEAVEELKELLKEKAADLFSICDQEDKGFVTKRDMQRMKDEMGLAPDQLEAVFDQLDVDKNGFLTLEEFTSGFGQYLGIECQQVTSHGSNGPGVDELVVEPPVAESVAELDEEDEFNLMLSELGILGLVDDDTALREMWLNLKRENDPDRLSNFEEFLSKLSKDLHRKNTEQEQFETVIKNRSILQEEHLQKLYEEMEQQIGAERQRIQAEEEAKERKLREELESTIRLKDQQMNEVMERMRTLSDQLDEAKKSVPGMVQENQSLAKERDKLQQELERQRILQKELHNTMEQLRNQTQAERKERAKAALKVSENIAMEREVLVNELDFMKALNAKMLDERDLEKAVMEKRSHSSAKELCSLDMELERGPQSLTSVASSGKLRSSAVQNFRDIAANSEFECDEDYFERNNDENQRLSKSKKASIQAHIKRYHSHPSSHDEQIENVSLFEELNGTCGAGLSLDDSDDPTSVDGSIGKGRNKKTRKRSSMRSRPGDTNVLIYNIHQRQQDQLRAQQQDSMIYNSTGPASATEDSDMTSSSMGLSFTNFVPPLSQLDRGDHGSLTSLQVPERVFKVICIGDSCVGKSSLITRFCTGKFQAGIKSTIGVDFHTRSLMVEGQSICLQVWDTAGRKEHLPYTSV